MPRTQIGFMQGRLSPLVDGRIQSFPWSNWQDEIRLAANNGFHLMEWTLDQDRLYENPLLTVSGQIEINKLCLDHRFAIRSLTGDCFMQAPFWKASHDKSDALRKDFMAIAEACSIIGINMIVVPLVDNGRLENQKQEDELVAFLTNQASFFADKNLSVIFESDFAPVELARFIARLPAPLFGINYDIGNSAALGFQPADEFAAYADRIVNVHVKDRVFGGTTVPLGTGDADFDQVFALLARAGYGGELILQTARANDESHLPVLCKYRQMVTQWMRKYGLEVQA